MIYTCIIVDDDPDSLNIIEDYIRDMPQLELLQTYSSFILAFAAISSGAHVDFIFTDIDMPGISGMELAKMIREKTTYLVLTTAHAEYAVDSYDVNASFYLLKPFSFTKFASSINKVLQKTVDSVTELIPKIKRSFFIKNISGKPMMTRVMTDDILYIEIKKEQLLIFTHKEKLTASLTLKEAERLVLGTGEFIKIHRSYIVAVNHIKNIEPMELMMTNGKVLPLGKAHKEPFLNYINKSLFKS